MASTQLTAAEQKFLWAERQQESGGNYKAVNSSSGALGAYQIMPANLPGWEAQAGLPAKGSTAFLNDSGYQDALATSILGGYYQKYGDAGAAAMWYSGQPDPNKNYGNPPVSVYVHDVLALESGAPSTGLPGGSGNTSGGTTAVQASDPLASGLGTVLGLFGINSTDILQRLALVLLGGVFIVIALIKMTGTEKVAKEFVSARTGGVVG